MDDLLHYLRQEIAMDGDDGTPANRLDAFVSAFYDQRASSGGPGPSSRQNVDDRFTEFVWAQLISLPDIKVARLEKLAPPALIEGEQGGEGKEATPLAGFGNNDSDTGIVLAGSEDALKMKESIKAARKDKGKKVRDARLAGAEQWEFNELPKEEVEGCSRSELVNRYGEDILRVAVDPETSFVALTGSHERRGKLTHLSYQVLQAIARGREHGKTVIELGREFDHDQKSLFHFVKNLVEMGLIVKLKIVDNKVKTQTSRCIHRHYLDVSPHWQLWITRDPEGALSGGNAAAGGGAGEGDDEDEDENEVDGAGGLAVLTSAHLNSNEPLVRARIVNALRAAPGKTIAHSELIYAIGFHDSPVVHDRRRLNRIVSNLATQGIVEKVGVVRKGGSAQLSCITLADKRLEGVETNAVGEIIETDQHKPNLLLTMSAERQVVDMLVAAGARGATLRDLRVALGDLSARILESQLGRYERNVEPPHLCDFQVQSVLETHGREKRLRYFTVAGYHARCRADGLADLPSQRDFTHPALAGEFACTDTLNFYADAEAFEKYMNTLHTGIKDYLPVRPRGRPRKSAPLVTSRQPAAGPVQAQEKRAPSVQPKTKRSRPSKHDQRIAHLRREVEAGRATQEELDQLIADGPKPQGRPRKPLAEGEKPRKRRRKEDVVADVKMEEVGDADSPAQVQELVEEAAATVADSSGPVAEKKKGGRKRKQAAIADFDGTEAAATIVDVEQQQPPPKKKGRPRKSKPPGAEGVTDPSTPAAGINTEEAITGPPTTMAPLAKSPSAAVSVPNPLASEKRPSTPETAPERKRKRREKPRPGPNGTPPPPAVRGRPRKYPPGLSKAERAKLLKESREAGTEPSTRTNSPRVDESVAPSTPGSATDIPVPQTPQADVTMEEVAATANVSAGRRTKRIASQAAGATSEEKVPGNSSAFNSVPIPTEGTSANMSVSGVPQTADDTTDQPAAAPETPPKRKRGRPRKHPLPEQPEVSRLATKASQKVASQRGSAEPAASSNGTASPNASKRARKQITDTSGKEEGNELGSGRYSKRRRTRRYEISWDPDAIANTEINKVADASSTTTIVDGEENARVEDASLPAKQATPHGQLPLPTTEAAHADPPQAAQQPKEAPSIPASHTFPESTVEKVDVAGELAPEMNQTPSLQQTPILIQDSLIHTSPPAELIAALPPLPVSEVLDPGTDLAIPTTEQLAALPPLPVGRPVEIKAQPKQIPKVNYSLHLRENEFFKVLQEAGGIVDLLSYKKLWHDWMVRRDGKEPPSLDRRTQSTVWSGIEQRQLMKRATIQIQGPTNNLVQREVFFLPDIDLDGQQMREFSRKLQDQLNGIGSTSGTRAFFHKRKQMEETVAHDLPAKSVPDRTRIRKLIEGDSTGPDPHAFFADQWRVVAQSYGWQYGSYARARTLHQHLIATVTDDNDSPYIVSSEPAKRIFASPLVTKETPLSVYMRIAASFTFNEELDAYLAETDPSQILIKDLPANLSAEFFAGKNKAQLRLSSLYAILAALQLLIPLKQVSEETDLVVLSGIQQEPRYFRKCALRSASYWLLANEAPLYNILAQETGDQNLLGGMPLLSGDQVTAYWQTLKALSLGESALPSIGTPVQSYPTILPRDAALQIAGKWKIRWIDSYLLLQGQKMYIRRVILEREYMEGIIDDDSALAELAYNVCAPVGVIREFVSKEFENDTRNAYVRAKKLERRIIERENSVMAAESSDSDLDFHRQLVKKKKERLKKGKTAGDVIAEKASQAGSQQDSMFDSIVELFAREHGDAAVPTDQLGFLREWFKAPGGLNAQTLREHLLTNIGIYQSSENILGQHNLQVKPFTMTRMPLRRKEGRQKRLAAAAQSAETVAHDEASDDDGISPPPFYAVLISDERKTAASGWNAEEDDQLRDFYVILQTRASHLGQKYSGKPLEAFYQECTPRLLLDRLRRLVSHYGDAPYLDALQEAWREFWLRDRGKVRLPDPKPRSYADFDLLAHRGYLCRKLNKQSIRFQSRMPTGGDSSRATKLPLDPTDLFAEFEPPIRATLRNIHEAKSWDYLWSAITTAQKVKDYNYRSFLTQCSDEGVADDHPSWSSGDRVTLFGKRHRFWDTLAFSTLEEAADFEKRLVLDKEMEWPLVAEDGDMLALATLFSENLLDLKLDTSVTLEGRPYTDYRTRKIDDESFENTVSLSLKGEYTSRQRSPLFE